VSESSTTISLEKRATAKIFSRGITRLMRAAQTTPLIEIDRTRPLVDSHRTKPLVESDGTEARHRAPGWALPLLLLAVIALFVFAYIAQK